MAMREETTFTPDNLFFDPKAFPVVTATLSIPAGSTLKRGALLTSEGALVKSTTTSGESGSTTTWDDVYGVLADDVTSGSTAVEAIVYLTGVFQAKALSVNSANTVAQFKPLARKVGIFIKDSI